MVYTTTNKVHFSCDLYGMDLLLSINSKIEDGGILFRVLKDEMEEFNVGLEIKLLLLNVEKNIKKGNLSIEMNWRCK